MFSELTDYRKADFFRQHTVVDMSTLFSADKWLVFGAIVLDPNEINTFDYTDITFQDVSAFEQYVSAIEKRSLYKTDVDIGTQDDLLLLVTDAEDEYGFDGAKFLVACRRLRDGESPAETMQITRNATVLMPRKWVYMHRGTTTRRTTAATTAASTLSSATTQTVATTVPSHTATPTDDAEITTTDTANVTTTATQTAETTSE